MQFTRSELRRAWWRSALSLPWSVVSYLAWAWWRSVVNDRTARIQWRKRLGWSSWRAEGPSYDYPTAGSRSDPLRAFGSLAERRARILDYDPGNETGGAGDGAETDTPEASGHHHVALEGQ